MLEWLVVVVAGERNEGNVPRFNTLSVCLCDVLEVSECEKRCLLRLSASYAMCVEFCVCIVGGTSERF